MLSCCKPRKPPAPETQPLLPQHEDDTVRQRYLHEKLRTYEILRALSHGYMPSTSQAAAHLRALVASDVLNPDNPSLSLASRQLARDCRVIIRIFIDILCEKNGKDQLQEFLWQISRSKASLDAADLAGRASAARARADTAAAYDSLRTVGRLLLTNPDFRRLVNDLNIVGRSIYSDVAASISAKASEVAKEIAPSEEEEASIEAGAAGPSDRPPAPDTEELQQDVQDVIATTAQAVKETGQDAIQSAKDKTSGPQRNALLQTLKQAVISLRKRDDYTTSVSTLSELIQRYANIYSHAIDETVSAAREDVELNAELKNAIRNLWDFLGTFGTRKEWNRLEEKFHKLIRNSEQRPGFKVLVDEISVALHNLLTDPGSIDSAEATIENLKTKSNEAYSDSVRKDADEFLHQFYETIQAVSNDKTVLQLVTAVKKFASDVSVAYYKDNTAIPRDLLHIFLPLLIRTIQHIPIPRLEISEPEMDLLIENLILEPGHTIHSSSFLPFKVLASVKSDLELRKTHSKEATTGMKNVVTLSLYGLNISAKEFGYWVRVHSPPFLPYLSDEGIASFFLDRRGVDISVDIEIGRERLEQMISLRAVRVHIHKLDYTIQKSAWFGVLWLFKPFLKHMIRRILEKKIAEQIAGYARIINRELVFARERLRATRISNPSDFMTFIHAVLSRLSAKPDPDSFIRVGIDAHRKGVFKDRYAPGSLVKMWHDEQRRAEEAIEGGETPEQASWRNTIFNLPSQIQ